MRKLFQFIGLVTLITVTVLIACSKSSKTSEPKAFETKEFELTEKASFEILKSPESQKLITLQNQFLDKISGAIARGISLEEIEVSATNAVEGKNEKLFLDILFGTEEEGNKFIAELQQGRKDFLTKFSIFEKNKKLITCIECQKITSFQVDKFFDNFGAYNKRRLRAVSSNSNFDSREQLVDDGPCGSFWKELKLLGCMSLCSVTTAGIGTPFCGWGCWCTFCADSATGNLIC
jgi:hypothetical protein